jgi:hypothetical protein
MHNQSAMMDSGNSVRNSRNLGGGAKHNASPNAAGLENDRILQILLNLIETLADDSLNPTRSRLNRVGDSSVGSLGIAAITKILVKSSSTVSGMGGSNGGVSVGNTPPPPPTSASSGAAAAGAAAEAPLGMSVSSATLAHGASTHSLMCSSRSSAGLPGCSSADTESGKQPRGLHPGHPSASSVFQGLPSVTSTGSMDRLSGLAPPMSPDRPTTSNTNTNMSDAIPANSPMGATVQRLQPLQVPGSIPVTRQNTLEDSAALLLAQSRYMHDATHSTTGNSENMQAKQGAAAYGVRAAAAEQSAEDDELLRQGAIFFSPLMRVDVATVMCSAALANLAEVPQCRPGLVSSGALKMIKTWLKIGTDVLAQARVLCFNKLSSPRIFHGCGSQLLDGTHALHAAAAASGGPSDPLDPHCNPHHHSSINAEHDQRTRASCKAFIDAFGPAYELISNAAAALMHISGGSDGRLQGMPRGSGGNSGLSPRGGGGGGGLRAHHSNGFGGGGRDYIVGWIDAQILSEGLPAVVRRIEIFHCIVIYSICCFQYMCV